ncbi:hypothetical protein [Primorskyibacter sp. S187A]|uniref:hypothetical protein n=1 Tax=Primorskyibacter sp. S187A TaxID=3415130 RepID=UPI003C7AD1E0
MSTDTIIGLIGLAGGTISGFLLGNVVKPIRLAGLGLLVVSLLAFVHFSEQAAADDRKYSNMLETRLETLLDTTDHQSNEMREFRECFNRRMDDFGALDSILGCPAPEN